MSRRGLQKAIKRGTWRGHTLTTRESYGNGGKRREVLLSSLPPELQQSYLLYNDNQSTVGSREGTPLAGLGDTPTQPVGDTSVSTLSTPSTSSGTGTVSRPLRPFRLQRPAQEPIQGAVSPCSKRKKALLQASHSEQIATLDNLSEGEKQALQARETVVQLWLSEQAKPRAMGRAAFLTYLHYRYKTDITYSTLNRWRRAYEQNGLLGLLDTRGRQAKQYTKIHGWIEAKISKEFWLSYGEVKAKHLWRDINATAYQQGLIESYEWILNPQKRPRGKTDKPWQIISSAAVGRYLNRLRAEQSKALALVRQPDKAHSKYSPAFGNMAEMIERVNELWEIDSSPFDVMTLTLGHHGQEEQFRHTLVSIIDVKSRVAVVCIFERSNSLAVVRTLQAAIEQLGLPEAIRMDNGKDYLSTHVQESLRVLDIYPYFARPFKGEDKPFVERAFKSIQHDFSERLQGFLGHDVGQRIEREARVKKEDRLQGKKTQLSDLEPVEEVQSLLREWLEHSYLNRFHSGIKATPYEVFEAGAKDIRRVDKAVLVYAFGERAEGKMVGKKGIRHRNIFYQSPELAAQIGLRVNLRIDLNNSRQAYVFDVNGHYLCTARDSEHAPLSAEERKASYKIYEKHLKELKQAQSVAARYLPEEQGGMIERELAAAKKAIQGQDLSKIGTKKALLSEPGATFHQQRQAERLAILEQVKQQADADELRDSVRNTPPSLPTLKVVETEEPPEDERAIRLRMIAAIHS